MNPRTLFLISAFAGTLLSLPAFAQEHSHLTRDEKLWSQADAYFDPAEMAEARGHVLEHNGDQPFSMLMIDRAEIQFSDGEETGVWDASFWYGGDINKLYVKTEGEYGFEESEFEDAEVQLLWSRAVSRYFDVQTGLRYDFEPDGLAHLAFGFQGLAPYWFEVDGAAYLSEEGDLTADFEAEYEFFLTQRLILQPRMEVQFSAQDIPEREIGAGLTNAEAGVRLRYEVDRQFAPYVGVEYQSAFGETRDFIEAGGGEADRTVFVLGLRSWF